MSYSNDTEDIVTATDHVSIISGASTVRHGRVPSEASSLPSSQLPQQQQQQQQQQQRRTLPQSDPPADIPSRYSESIIMTADGIQQQQARWNQLQQQQKEAKSRNVPPDERILPSGASLAASRNSRNNRSSYNQVIQNTDGMTTLTTEPQYYATLENVESISVCSELSTTLISGDTIISPSILSMPNHGDHSHIDTSSISSEDRSALYGRRGATGRKNYGVPHSLVTEYPNSTINNPSYLYTNKNNSNVGFNIDESDDDLYTTTTTSQYNMNDFNHIPASSEIEEPHPPRRTKRITERDVENSTAPPPPLDPNMIASNSGISNNKRYQSIAVVVVVVWITICVVVVGAVCGSGVCSPNKDAVNNTSMNGNTINDVDNSTNDDGDGDDVPIGDNDTFGIEAYLRTVSLTNMSLDGTGNADRDEILQQADKMAINWIVNKYSTSVNGTDNTGEKFMNISDAIEQQRVQQLYAIVTFYYSTNMNDMNWTFAENWLQPQTNECDWYGIECSDENSENTRHNDNKQPVNDELNSATQFDDFKNVLALNSSDTNATLLPLPSTTSTLATSVQPTTAPLTPSAAPFAVPPLPFPDTLILSEQAEVPNSEIVSIFESSSNTSLPIAPTIPPLASATPMFTQSPVVAPTTTQPTIIEPSSSPSLSFRTVTTISLPKNGILGPINPNMGLLTRLTELDLSKNSLSGTIPSSFSFFTNLMKFNLRANNLSGTIPIEIVPSWSYKIRRFYVGSNELTGAIPENIGLWNKIRYFSINDNQFSGSIPETIFNWTAIVVAEFDNNELVGTVSDAFCTYVNESDAMEFITVDQGEVDCTCCDNKIDMTNAPDTVVPTTKAPTVSPLPTTSAPSTLSPIVLFPPIPVISSTPVATAFTTFQSYIVSVAPSGGANDLDSQTIDAENQAIAWLESNGNNLRLNPNDISSQFHIRQWYALLTLYFSTTGLSWVLTDVSDECSLDGVACETSSDLMAGQQLTVTSIFLSNNFLQGQLSPDLALLPYIKFFDASQNTLNGTLPNTLSSWSQINHFDISNNPIGGTIPDVLQNWTNLSYLSLYNNDFSGTIPQALSNCIYLEKMYLSFNNLSGTIPEALITSTVNMKDFQADYNFLTGTLSTSLGTSWSNIEIFNVANNQITGTIPDSLSSWTNATTINISGNQLSGTIPSSLCDFMVPDFQFDANAVQCPPNFS